MSVLLLLPSCGQVRMPRVGAARVSRKSSAARAAGSGRRATVAAQRAVSGRRAVVVTGRSAVSPARPALCALRTLRGRSRLPARPQRAGTRVIAAAMTASTAIAVAKPKLE